MRDQARRVAQGLRAPGLGPVPWLFCRLRPSSSGLTRKGRQACGPDTNGRRRRLSPTLCWIGPESEGLVRGIVVLGHLRQEEGTGRFTSSHGVLSHRFSGPLLMTASGIAECDRYASLRLQFFSSTARMFSSAPSVTVISLL